MKYLLLLSGVAFACPMFVEFFPNPETTTDQYGEFIEIRLDETIKADSLFLQIDEKKELAFPYPQGKRFLLSHNDTLCVKKNDLACGDLGKISLVNTRESVWKMKAGSCLDSVVIEKPKPDKSFQRIKESNNWIWTQSTPGMANPSYELNIKDCGFSYIQASFAESLWQIKGMLLGCESSELFYEYRDILSNEKWKKDSLKIEKNFSFDIANPNGILLKLFLPEDDAPTNNELDTLLYPLNNSPITITEVHHCPAEPSPEWIEIFNNSMVSLPLSKIKLCEKEISWGGDVDSIFPQESIVITKDTLSWRDYFLINDVHLIQTQLGYLNNTGGKLSICYKNSVLDSAWWNKETVQCPSGFNPQTNRADNTPGFQRSTKKQKAQEPFTYKLSSRIVSKKRGFLRVKVSSEKEVSLRLLDSSGRSVWKQSLPAMSNSWWNMPVQEYLSIGISYIRLVQGSYEKTIGIVVRP